MVSSENFDVFVSYRRETAAETARLLQFALQANQFRVFLDVNDLGRGFFDDALLRVIENTPNFILVLTPNALKRCRESGDWMFQEIAHAVRTNRNIVPVMMPGFAFPPDEDLPDELQLLHRHNAVSFHHEYFDAMVTRLMSFLRRRLQEPSVAPQPVVSARQSNPPVVLDEPFLIFLSLGGVLRRVTSKPLVLDSDLFDRFVGILRSYPGAHVVVTSTWKRDLGIEEIAEWFPSDLRSRVVGVTSEFERTGRFRSAEIRAYLKQHGYTRRPWIAIDDDLSRYRQGAPVLVTDPKTGFDAHAAKKLKMLIAARVTRGVTIGSIRDDRAETTSRLASVPDRGDERENSATYPLANAPTEGAKRVASNSEIAETSVETGVLLIDCTEFEQGAYQVVSQWPSSVQALLDWIYLTYLKRFVPMYSYGEHWGLFLPESSERIRGGSKFDSRPLEDFDISEGSILCVRRVGRHGG